MQKIDAIRYAMTEKDDVMTKTVTYIQRSRPGNAY